MEQILLTGNESSESYEEYSKSDDPDTDYDVASCDDLEPRMDEAFL